MRGNTKGVNNHGGTGGAMARKKLDVHRGTMKRKTNRRASPELSRGVDNMSRVHNRRGNQKER